MTCIIGLIDESRTWMGCDSLASNSTRQFTLKQRKIFKLKDTSNAVIGFSGAVRDLNIMQYANNLIDYRDEPKINHEYIVKNFIPNVIQLLKNNGRNEVDKGVDEQLSYFLLAYKNQLWRIESNYAVMSTTDNYNAIGSGTHYALGSLMTTENMELSPIKRIHLALQAASKFNPGVAPPFYIINTENDKVIEFKE